MEIGVALPNFGPLATKDSIFAIAEKAEDLGLDALWTSDHITLPRHPTLPYPYSRGAPAYFGKTPGMRRGSRPLRSPRFARDDVNGELLT